MPHTEERRDGPVACGLALVALSLTWALVARFDAPFEDAAMLLRYSQHLADGDGITWNRGEPPVDGATDFLYMVTVAGLTWLGAPVVLAGKLLSIACHVATVPVIYLANRRSLGVSRALACIAALAFAIGPGIALISAHFGTPMFALGAALTWAQALRIREHGANFGAASVFSLLALLTSLVRPEGVFLTVLMLASLVIEVERGARIRLLRTFAMIFGGLGGAYFIWRWSYFGHPLPNPFYKKGGGHLYPASLLHSLENVLRAGGVFLAFHIAALVQPNLASRVRFSLIPILGFSAIWLFLSDEMNFAGRFQYPLLPIILMSFGPFAVALARSAGLGASVGTRGRGLFLIGATCALAFGAFQFRRAFPPSFASYLGLREVGLALRPYQDRGYTIAVSEAGLLPLYSGWKSVDVWGLNDSRIAHDGRLTHEYLSTRAPEVILYHSFSSPFERGPGRETLRGWNEMVGTLEAYIQAHDYALVAAYGNSTTETHWYFVRRDLSDHESLARAITEVSYDWLGPCVNWATMLGGGAPLLGAFTSEASLNRSSP